MSLKDKFKKIFNINQKNNYVATPNNKYDANFDPINLNTRPLSVTESLSLSYITRSIQMIANDVAKTDFTIYKYDAKKIHREIENNTSLNWILNRQPNKFLNAYDFKKIIVWNLLLFGTAPIYPVYEIDQNGKNRLISLIPIYPEIVTQQKDKNGDIYYSVTLKESVNSTVNFRSDEIIYLTYESIMNVENVNISTLFKSTFNKLIENEKSVYNAILNDIGVSFIIDLPDITNEETKNNVLNSFNNMMINKKKTGSIAMIKDKSWDVNSSDAFIESKIDYQTRNAIAREVAAMFGIPPSKLGIEDTNKYNSMVERHRQYIDDAIKPILQNITKTLTSFFFLKDMTHEISFKAIDLISLDPNTLSTFGSSAINNGFATPNEIRELMGLEPIKDGDHLLANGSLTPISLNIAKAKQELLNLKQSNKKPDFSEPKKEQSEQQEEQETEPLNEE